MFSVIKQMLLKLKAKNNYCNEIEEYTVSLYSKTSTKCTARPELG